MALSLMTPVGAPSVLTAISLMSDEQRTQLRQQLGAGLDISSWAAADDAALLALSYTVDGQTAVPSVGDIAFFPDGSIKRLVDSPHTVLENWVAEPGVVSVNGRTGIVLTQIGDIQGSGATGRSLLAATDASAARLALGLSAVAASGSYNDLTDKPALFSGSYTDLTNKPVISDITGTTESDLYGNTTIGASVVTGAGKSNTLFGRGAKARNNDSYALSSYCVLLGNYTSCWGDYSVAAGYGATAYRRSVALGNQTTAGTGSVTIGFGGGDNGFGAGYTGRIELRANDGNGYTTCRVAGVPNGTIYQSYAVTDTAPTDYSSFTASQHGDLQIPRRMWGLRVNTAGKPILDINNGGTVTSVTIPTSSLTGVTSADHVSLGAVVSSGSYDALVGYNITSGGGNAIVGHSASSAGSFNVLMGQNTNTGSANYNVAIGYGSSTANAGNASMVVGPNMLVGIAGRFHMGTRTSNSVDPNYLMAAHKTTKEWSQTFYRTDSAPTDGGSLQMYTNADGTLLQGMSTWRISATDNIPTMHFNIGGTVTSYPVSNRKLVAINAQTGTTYTTVAGDAGKVVTLTNASAITVTLSNLAAGSRCVFEQLGAGQVTFAAGEGNTIRHVASLTKIAGQWGRVWCRVDSNGTDYILSGDMA